MSAMWWMNGLCVCMFWTGICLIYADREGVLLYGLRTLHRTAAGSGKEFFVQKKWESFGAVVLFQSWRREQKQYQMEWEIGEAISYLHNAVAMGRGESMSAGLILEELADLQGQLSSVYMRMLHCLHLNEKEKVTEVFTAAVRGEMAEDFSRLLLQWEELPPPMLVEALESYQKTIRESRLTKQKKRDEMISDIIYLPVILNVMLVLINFIYVAYFIDQREMLLTMFG